MGILWPHSNTVARTNADRRAPGALAYFFEAGTTTPRTTYQDADLTTPHAHPVVADGYGRFPAVFLDFGSYRERVKTAGNTQLWDTDDIPESGADRPGEGVVESRRAAENRRRVLQFHERHAHRRGSGERAHHRQCDVGRRASAPTPTAWTLFTELYNAMSNTLCPVRAMACRRGANAAADFAAGKTLTLPDLRGSVPPGLDTMGNRPHHVFDASVPVRRRGDDRPGSTRAPITPRSARR